MPFGLIPILGLSLLALYGLFVFPRSFVEQTTLRTAQDALQEAGATWATPAVSGQWVVVEGTAPSPEAAASALAAVRAKKARTFFGMRARPATRVTGNFTGARRACAHHCASAGRGP